MTRIDEIDVHVADDDVLRARWEAMVAVERELSPEDPVLPFEQHKAELLTQPSFYRPRHWVAWDDDGTSVVGYATLSLEYTDSNRHLAWWDLGVRPESRRKGLGTALVHRMTEAAQLDARTVVGSHTNDGHAGDAFAEALGFEKKATERKSRLEIAEVDLELMREWVAAADVRARDYELFSYDGPTPDELVDDIVDLYHVTNTAPRDDLDLEDTILTPERLRESESKMVAIGTERWRAVVRHTASGQLAGFTEFWFAKGVERVAWQGWTAVRPEHRNHGLGRWLKAANLLRLVDERPAVEAVDTWNAFSNGPMLAINVAMGFALVRGYNDWQAPVERVLDATKQRLH